MSFINVLNQDGLSPKYRSSTNNGEYSSSCPWCGGDDRFRIWPNQGNGGRWWCRRCQKAGDAIDYLREKRSMNFSDAKNLIGNHSNINPHEQSKKYVYLYPSADWVTQANVYANRFRLNLSSLIGNNARDHLSRRGLKDQSVYSSYLGYNPSDLFLSREDWGLGRELNDNRNLKKVWIPKGIVIPYYFDGKIIRLKIRRDDVMPGESRYVVVSGSSSKPMMFGVSDYWVVVESELDALLLWQEVGDFLGVVSLGNATAKPKDNVLAKLSMAKQILVALDSDDAGKSASEWWINHFHGKAKRWPMPGAKDPSEAFERGLNIRLWAVAGLFDKTIRQEKTKLGKINFPIDFDRAVEQPGYLKHVIRSDTDSMMLTVPLKSRNFSNQEKVELAKKVSKSINDCVVDSTKTILERANINPKYCKVDFKLESVIDKAIIVGKKQEAYSKIGDSRGVLGTPIIVTKGLDGNRVNSSWLSREIQKNILNIIFDNSISAIEKVSRINWLISDFRKRFILMAKGCKISLIGISVKYTSKSAYAPAMEYFNKLSSNKYFQEGISGRLVHINDSNANNLMIAVPFDWNDEQSLRFLDDNKLAVDDAQQWKKVYSSSTAKIIEIAKYSI